MEKIGAKGIVQKLSEIYPTARPGFINVLIDALELHARKNNDYNGTKIDKIPFTTFETMAKMADVRRKYSRLYHLLAENVEPKVDENLEDTVIDLGVYAFLLLEYLREAKKMKNKK